MDVALLVVDQCPMEELAAQRLRESLDALGLPDQRVRRVLITSEADADAHRFTGSPSVHVDGVDLFPTEGTPGNTCRLYPHGFPSAAALTQALQRATAERPPPAS